MSACLTVARKELRDHSRGRPLARHDSQPGPHGTGHGPANLAIAGGGGSARQVRVVAGHCMGLHARGCGNRRDERGHGRHGRGARAPVADGLGSALCPHSSWPSASGSRPARLRSAACGAERRRVRRLRLGVVTFSSWGQCSWRSYRLALLASAVGLLLASLCRTTKEAHAWGWVGLRADGSTCSVVFTFGARWATGHQLLPVVGQPLRLLSQALAGARGR